MTVEDAALKEKEKQMKKSTHFPYEIKQIASLTYNVLFSGCRSLRACRSRCEKITCHVLTKKNFYSKLNAK